MEDEIKNSELEQQDTDIEESGDSHEYDGIKELNNPAPYWIMAVFIVTIGFSIIYAIHNFGYPGNAKDQDSVYNKSVAKFDDKLRERKAKESGQPLEMSQDQILAAGATYYVEKGCTACHGAAGEGNAIGPNLTDNFWINGCTEEEIATVIRDGKPTKGMTPYKTMMTEEQITHLSSYIKHSMIGSEPSNPKDPQGEECK